MANLSSHVGEFLDYLVDTGRAPRTIEAYQGRLAELLELAGNRAVETIRLSDLESIANGDGARSNKRSDTTKAMRIQAIKTFFQFCCNRGYIANSPARDLQRPSRAQERGEDPRDLALVQQAAVSSNMAIEPGADLPSLISEYLDYQTAMGRSPRTVEENFCNLSKFAEYFVGYEVQQIKPRMLDAYVSSLRSDSLADATISTKVQAIKAFLKFCVSRGYLAGSPGNHLVRPKYINVRQDKVMSLSELQTLCEFTEKNGYILENCLLLFLADTGARVGELISLNIRNLDLIDCSAVVTGKTGERYVFFTEPTAEALKRWIAIRPRTDPDAVFTSRVGRLNTWTVYHYLEDIANQVGVTRYNPQSIRHLVGQSWVDKGVNLELVRIKLGHRDINTTARFYTHQDRERSRSASRKYSIVGGMA